MTSRSTIDALVGDLRPVRPRAVERRIAMALAGGGTIALILVIAALKLRPDLGPATATAAFWAKLAYTLALTMLGVGAALRLARPDAGGGGLAWLGAPVAMLAVLAGAELAGSPRGQWAALFWGQSWRECPLLIVLVAAPVAAALTAVYRGFAPADPRRAGAMVGLASGALGAALYSLHCPETALTFLLFWYSLGIAAVTALGAAVGARLFRW